ncbi:MAG: cell division ATP-binding protein FtsE [Patescibacteria group bacterium]
MIKFESVTKSYKDGTVAVEDLTLSIPSSSFVFLVGPSGAGKTTLIKLLIHEELPSSGSIFVDGVDITKMNKKMLPELRRKIGVVFQDFKLLNSKTVFENVAVSLEVVDRPEYEISQIVPNALNLVGLSSKMKSFPYQLSGGEKQRLTIARALAHEPKVLIADEPTGNIDPIATAEVVDLLEKINGLGTLVIMATHDMDIVNKLKKRVIVLDKGKVVQDVDQGGNET